MMGYPSEHPPPYQVSRHSKQINVTTSLMFIQMSSPRWQMMDVLNEQQSTPVLGAASRYPKDLIFKTYKSTWTIINVLTLLQTILHFNAVVAFGFVLNTLLFWFETIHCF